MKHFVRSPRADGVRSLAKAPFLGWMVLGLTLWPASPLRGQVVNDSTTNTLSNVTNTFSGDVTIGTNGSLTLLVLANNALLTNSANGVIGRNATARSNEVRLLGPSARWRMGNHLFVGNDGSFNRLVVSNGATVRDNNGFLGPNAASSNNVAVVTGPGSVWSNANVFYLGFGGAGNQLVVSNGGVLRAKVSNAGVNFSSSNNVAVVTGSGSLWSNAMELQFGFGGAGNQLVISNGGVVRSGLGYLGTGASASNNVAMVTGSGSLWSNTTDLYVSHSGTGNQLVVSDGGAVRNGHGYVGANATASNNLALVTGLGSVWSNALDLEVGAFSGNNRMVVSNGATVFTAGKGVIGPTANGNANSAVVTDAGSLWRLGNTLYVGSNGAFNRLLISDGGQVRSGGGVSGAVGWDSAGSNNLAVVTGSGSLWSNANSFYVGVNGTANQLVVSNGAIVVSDQSFVGSNIPSSNNVATVTGPGSRWDTAGVLYLGFDSAGNRLAVNDGGVMRDSSAYLGVNSTSSNNVALVTGAGSKWSNTFELRVGYLGPGNQLVVSNGGAVFTRESGFIGHSSGANANSATVTDPGSRWDIGSHLYVGSNSALNRLVISNGALVVNSNAFLGFNGSSRSNTALVTGAGTVWSNRQTLVVGQTGAVNRVVVSDGARLETRFGTLGASTAATNNEVVVTGPGSFWRLEQGFTVGNFGSGNRLVITNGGRVRGSGTIGLLTSSNNEVVVTGAGSSWTNGSTLLVGGAGSGNRLVIRDGGEVFEQPFGITVGSGSSSLNNRLVVDGGSLRALSPSGVLDVRRGTNVLNAGLIDVTLLLLTNAQGKFECNGGTLVTRGALISSPFVVGGSGGAPAVWDVRAGASNHFTGSLFVGSDDSFNQLLVTNGASLTSRDGFIGFNAGANSNSAIVSGAGSRWVAGGDFGVGQAGSFNSLIISNGGCVASAFTDIGVSPGSSNNVAVVTGLGSSWSNALVLEIGESGSGNRLLISDGATVFASNVVNVGVNVTTSSNNLVHINGGTLRVQNLAGAGTLNVRSGTNRLDAGLIDVDRLVITNARGIFEFNGGTLRTAGTTIGTGRVLTVGNGTSTATLELRGGTHVFLGGLVVANHASLTGNGALPGALTVQAGGTLAPGASIGALAFNIAPVLQGATVMEISKNGATLTTDQVQVAGTLNYGGSLTVSNIGPTALAAGDRFPLFSAASYSGSFSGISLPALAAGLNWANKLLANGSIEVVPWSGPKIGSVTVSGTNLIFEVADGLPGGAYDVITSTNVALPLLNWTILSSGTFDWLGHATVTNGIASGESARFLGLRAP